MRTTKLLVGALLCGALTASAQSKIDASVSYEMQRSNGPAGECGCFSLQGGRADGSYRVFGRFSVAGEISGAHASNITGSGVDLSLLTYMAGPRYSLHLKHGLKPFAQFLIWGRSRLRFDISSSRGSGLLRKLFRIYYRRRTGLRSFASHRCARRADRLPQDIFAQQCKR